jgi:hypothetical protein
MTDQQDPGQVQQGLCPGAHADGIGAHHPRTMSDVASTAGQDEPEAEAHHHPAPEEQTLDEEESVILGLRRIHERHPQARQPGDDAPGQGDTPRHPVPAGPTPPHVGRELECAQHRQRDGTDDIQHDRRR